MIANSPADLIVLAADLDIEHTVRSLLDTRASELGLRTIRYDLFRHPNRDSGCFQGAVEFLRTFLNRYRHAIVILDRYGSGHDDWPRIDIESDIEQRLHSNGWNARARAVAIDPELEAWVWSDSEEVARQLGWQSQIPGLWPWLVEERLLETGQAKPARPKAALLHVLRHTGRRRSASLFGELADQVNFQSCQDPAFRKLTQTLRGWFPRDPGATPTP